MDFSQLPKIDPDSPLCVRLNRKLKRYELVVDGEVTASVGEFAFNNVRAARAKFAGKVNVAIRGSVIDRTVERLYADVDQHADV